MEKYAPRSGRFTLASRPVRGKTGGTVPPPTGKEAALESLPRIQIRLTNDYEILAFFNAHDVKYSLTGDHLFVIHGRECDMRAGPGDWLCVESDGDVAVERGVYELHAQRVIEAAQHATR